MNPLRPRLSWPDRPRWRAYFKYIALFDALFFPIYFGAGAIAAQASHTYGLYASWEQDIPLVPWMIWPYISLLLLFNLPVFHLDPGQLQRLSRQSTTVLLVAGTIFVLMPTHLGFQPTTNVGSYEPVFSWLARLDTPHNAAPSLHVAVSTLILLACASTASRPLAWIYRLWLALISASTVLVHQHHLLDVASGMALAVLVRSISPVMSAATVARQQTRSAVPPLHR